MTATQSVIDGIVDKIRDEFKDNKPVLDRIEKSIAEGALAGLLKYITSLSPSSVHEPEHSSQDHQE